MWDLGQNRRQKDPAAAFFLSPVRPRALMNRVSAFLGSNKEIGNTKVAVLGKVKVVVFEVPTRLSEAHSEGFCRNRKPARMIFPKFLVSEFVNSEFLTLGIWKLLEAPRYFFNISL